MRYTKDQKRVAKWINDNLGVGGGDDPIGFVLASLMEISTDKTKTLLIMQLAHALKMAAHDVEKVRFQPFGFKYGKQSVIVKALQSFDRWVKKHNVQTN